MNNYELSYDIAVYDKKFDCMVSERTVQGFVAFNNRDAKQKVKTMLESDQRHKKGNYNVLYHIVRQEIV
jgi:hypothetical protein